MKNATLYLDQWGNRFYATSRKDLRQQIRFGGSRVSKMYRDKKDGSVVHCGYIIGTHWLIAYAPVEIKEA